MRDVVLTRPEALHRGGVGALPVGHVPQFVQTPMVAGYGFGASVIEAGLFMVPSTIVMLVAELPAGPRVRIDTPVGEIDAVTDASVAVGDRVWMRLVPERLAVIGP